ncbi:AP-5 complex subunit zeta-1-like [Dendronephthya gigantea]|uniref:AP-5 complex subunit zeta-1-like n=1 Tax=Dendronephthya gigantea TaxID=151771 RepID=UPI00106A1A1E|nr:AP-5 complex subunit zeta-1-like [Dendronephthya gigantea]XP_028395176.1 AP-5 complex subunit zeta-1-like [Dendronephthya gigantea]
MAVLKTSEDYLLVQSRSFSDQDFAQHVRQTASCIARGDRGSECAANLRDLYRYLACKTKRRSFSDELLKQLKSMIVEPGKSPKALRLLAMLILRELSPTVGYSIKISSLSADFNWLPLVFPLIFAQGEELGHIASHVPIFIRWLKSSPGSNSYIQRKALLCLYSIQNNYGVHLLGEDQVTAVNQLMLQWLTNTSLYSAPNPYQRTIFNKSKQKLQRITELDGSACQTFFTVLNLAQYCFPDQWLNIYTFSILRQWLLNTWRFQESLGEFSVDIPPEERTSDSPFSTTAGSSFSEPAFLDDRILRTPGADEMYEEISDKHSSPSFSEITQAFSDNNSTPIREADDNVSIGSYSNLSNMRQVFGSESSFFTESSQDGSLARKAMSYCYRLLRQSECKPSTSQDATLVRACIIEAVSLMDFCCIQETDLAPKAVQAVRRVYSVVKMWSVPKTVVLPPIILFLVNHGEAVILDSEPYLKFLFGEVLFSSFTSPEVAFEILTFCYENMEKLRQSTNVFTQFFPNIFKILAWFPRTFLKEFMELLPAMISRKTYIEIFHFLLDLPCLSAALETMKQALKRNSTESSTVFRKSVEAYENVKYKPLFTFILRQESGIADTIDKLDVLHSVFEDFAEHPRVLVSSEVSWLMLRVYFKTILKKGDADVIRKLFPVLLERIICIINIESFKKNIQSLLATELLTIFKLYPSLVLEHSNEIIEFVHRMKSLDEGFEQFFTNLVWVIGEYASSKYNEKCGNQHIIKFHEAIESVTYELALAMTPEGIDAICSSRLVCVLMSTLAKLASRCQDLIPKVILCINKVSKLRSELCVDQVERENLLIRASELISLLKLPNIAPLILTPEPSLKEGRFHRDRHISMSFLMDTTKDMLFSQ